VAFLLILMVTLSSGATVADPVWSIQPTWSGPYLTYDYTPQELGLSNYSSNGATGSWGAIGLAINIAKYSYNPAGDGWNLLGLNISGHAEIRDDLPVTSQGTGSVWYSVERIRIEVYRKNYITSQELQFRGSLMSGYNVVPLYSNPSEQEMTKKIESILEFVTAVGFSALALAMEAAGMPVYAYSFTEIAPDITFFIGKNVENSDWRLYVYGSTEDPAIVTFIVPRTEKHIRVGIGNTWFLWWINPGYSSYSIEIKLIVTFVKQQLQARVGVVTIGREEVSTSCTLNLYKPLGGGRKIKSISPVELQESSSNIIGLSANQIESAELQVEALGVDE